MIEKETIILAMAGCICIGVGLGLTISGSSYVAGAALISGGLYWYGWWLKQ